MIVRLLFKRKKKLNWFQDSEVQHKRNKYIMKNVFEYKNRNIYPGVEYSLVRLPSADGGAFSVNIKVLQ